MKFSPKWQWERLFGHLPVKVCCVAPIVGFCPLMAPRVGLGLFSAAVVDVV